jgi:hypothetical protein
MGQYSVSGFLPPCPHDVTGKAGIALFQGAPAPAAFARKTLAGTSPTLYPAFVSPSHTLMIVPNGTFSSIRKSNRASGRAARNPAAVCRCSTNDRTAMSTSAASAAAASRIPSTKTLHRDNESAARVAEQTAADNLAARTRMVTQDAPNVAEVQDV